MTEHEIPTNEQSPTGRSPLRSEFHHQLDDLRTDVARLAAMVTENIPRATAILLDQDLEGAEAMIVADDVLDVESLELEERCYEMLALQQPVASDLRRIVAAMRIIHAIERSGDLTVNLCKAARRIYGQRLDPRLRGLIRRMGDQATALFKEATEAYLTDDAVRAAAIADMDSYLDDLQREFVQAMFERNSVEQFELQLGVQLAVVARFYERIGDHAVNIGERVLYLVRGPRHSGEAVRRYPERQAASDLA